LPLAGGEQRFIVRVVFVVAVVQTAARIFAHAQVFDEYAGRLGSGPVARDVELVALEPGQCESKAQIVGARLLEPAIAKFADQTDAQSARRLRQPTRGKGRPSSRLRRLQKSQLCIANRTRAISAAHQKGADSAQSGGEDKGALSGCDTCRSRALSPAQSPRFRTRHFASTAQREQTITAH
jgi:hypothetical protein